MTTLVILAAGLGSRFGSDKQLEDIHNGNALFDYAVYDALQAGFDNIVLIIRHEIDDLARQHLENRFNNVPITYVYQDDFYPQGIERKKPWGTGHAMLCIKDVVKNPFLIINADDYYGKEGFRLMYDALNSEKEKTFFSGGYLLKNTLSENGTVSRGICEVDKNHHLLSINEATKLRKINDTTAIDEATGDEYPLSTYVSMNFWGFTHDVLDIADRYFKEFVAEHKNDPKAEFYIPLVVQHAIKDYGYKLEVLPNHDTWFGMTYREDLAIVQKEMQKLINKGEYPDRF
ncbi:nucleotidyltransferase [Capnocytophaga sp. HP1101]